MYRMHLPFFPNNVVIRKSLSDRLGHQCFVQNIDFGTKIRRIPLDFNAQIHTVFCFGSFDVAIVSNVLAGCFGGKRTLE